MRSKLIPPPAQAPATLLAVYEIGRWSVQLEQQADGRIQWICGCEKFLSSAGRHIPPWCQHVSQAAARRSVERVTLERHVSRTAPH